MAVNIRQGVAAELKVGMGVVHDYKPGVRISGAVEAFYPTADKDNGLVIYRMVIRSAQHGHEGLHSFPVRADQPITIITEGSA